MLSSFTRAFTNAKFAKRNGGVVARSAAAPAPAASAVGLTPSVRIDNRSDPFATVVTVEYDMKEDDPFLSETITAMKNLGLNVVRAKIAQQKNKNVFFVTEGTTSDKLVKSVKIEEVRLAVLEILSKSPEMCDNLSFKASSSGPSESGKVLGVRKEGIATKVSIADPPTGSHSLVLVATRDRPGLLTDIVRVMKDLNLNVISAEIDTVGTQAIDTFFVTYKGEPLKDDTKLLTVNALQYYLQLREVESIESY